LASDQGGGGERVLWCAIQALQQNSNYKKDKIVIYAWSGVPDVETLVDKVHVSFFKNKIYHRKL
jgi:hypothetical protein